MNTIPFFAINKAKLIKFYWLVIFILTIAFVSSLFMTEYVLLWYELGKKAGNLAVGLFILSGTPGTLKRFGVTGYLQQVQLVLMMFRRQIGITMFLAAFAHYVYVKILPTLTFGLPFVLATFEQVGLLALFISLLLALTANDYFVRKLGKNWKRLQNLVYVIIWLVAVHVILVTGLSTTSVALVSFGVVQLLSWAYFLLRK